MYRKLYEISCSLTRIMTYELWSENKNKIVYYVWLLILHYNNAVR